MVCTTWLLSTSQRMQFRPHTYLDVRKRLLCATQLLCTFSQDKLGILLPGLDGRRNAFLHCKFPAQCILDLCGRRLPCTCLLRTMCTLEAKFGCRCSSLSHRRLVVRCKLSLCVRRRRQPSKYWDHKLCKTATPSGCRCSNCLQCTLVGASSWSLCAMPTRCNCPPDKVGILFPDPGGRCNAFQHHNPAVQHTGLQSVKPNPGTYQERNHRTFGLQLESRCRIWICCMRLDRCKR